jgi:hypothetical protein
MSTEKYQTATRGIVAVPEPLRLLNETVVESIEFTGPVGAESGSL